MDNPPDGPEPPRVSKPRRPKAVKPMPVASASIDASPKRDKPIPDEPPPVTPRQAGLTALQWVHFGTFWVLVVALYTAIALLAMPLLFPGPFVVCPATAQLTPCMPEIDRFRQTWLDFAGKMTAGVLLPVVVAYLGRDFIGAVQARRDKDTKR